MSITADFHLHSSFSGDSTAPMREMIEKGIDMGLTHMCFTEHHDPEYPLAAGEAENVFFLNTDAYLYDLLRARERYTGRISLLFGVELGLQPQIAKLCRTYVESYPFDFVIGSTHVCHGKDPYYPGYFDGRSEEEGYREYFNTVLENIRAFSEFDVCGHLDYVVRYGPDRDQNYTYEKYQDILDQILITLIQNGKGLEVNTGGTKKGLRELHPCTAVLRRYRELGGEIVTIGSDAHNPEHIALAFDRARNILTECGFRYQAIFEKRVPAFVRI